MVYEQYRFAFAGDQPRHREARKDPVDTLGEFHADAVVASFDLVKILGAFQSDGLGEGVHRKARIGDHFGEPFPGGIRFDVGFHKSGAINNSISSAPPNKKDAGTVLYRPALQTLRIRNSPCVQVSPNPEVRT